MAWNLDTKSGWNVETAAKPKREAKRPLKKMSPAPVVKEAMEKIEVKKEESVVEVPIELLLHGLKLNTSKLVNMDVVSTFTADVRRSNHVLITNIGHLEPRMTGNLARKGLYIATGGFIPMVVRDNEGQYVLVFSNRQ